MKSEINAFPTASWEYDGQGNVVHYQEQGMTLRDYFAAKAMQGGISHNRVATDKAGWAEWSYEMADAMLKAREAK